MTDLVTLGWCIGIPLALFLAGYVFLFKLPERLLYDRDWDKIISAALDEHGLKVGYYEAQVGPYTIWTGNYPYAYGKLKRGGSDCSGLPSMATRKRIRKMTYLARGEL